VLRPVSQRLPEIRTAAEVISLSPMSGLRLLRDSRAENQIHLYPDVYKFAAYLGQQFDCTHLIAWGRPAAKDLIQACPQFKIIGIVRKEDADVYRERYAFAEWLIAEELDSSSMAEQILRRAVIVCSDFLDEIFSRRSLLSTLKAWLDLAPVGLLADGENSLARPTTLNEWRRSLNNEGLNPHFVGWTARDSVSREKNTRLAIMTNHLPRPVHGETAPADFRVVAFMAAYNEADIIVQSIRKWTDQGVSVHILENWSTDETYNLIKQLEPELPVTVERFPSNGPSPFFDWGAMLARIESLCAEIKADWFVRRGADEVLRSPWPGVSYRDALYLADQAGFNCVDHTILEFHPLDNGFQPGMDHEAYFKHFDFNHLSHRFQRKAWKNYGQPISTIPSAGHDVLFEGRRVYPFKFLLKHYSFRSQHHGERKVFKDRKDRWNKNERARGWHIHYDGIKAGHKFLRAAAEKEFFEENHFNESYLVERLSGIGLAR